MLSFAVNDDQDSQLMAQSEHDVPIPGKRYHTYNVFTFGSPWKFEFDAAELDWRAVPIEFCVGISPISKPLG